MRKYVIGIAIGFTLSFAVSAHAAVENLIGKAVEGIFPVKVSGKQIDKQAIVIEGTSYLPVRAIGDALNMDVSFDADLGIGLTPKQTTTKEGETKVSETIPQSDLQSIVVTRFDKVNVNVFGKETTRENGEFVLAEAGGTQYVSLATLSGPYTINWKDPNATFHREGSQDIVVNVNNSFQPDINGFMLDGSGYVKLSLFGLTAVAQEKTLTVTQ